jgi:membrane fusion protein (multidrug efflux system)
MSPVNLLRREPPSGHLALVMSVFANSVSRYWQYCRFCSGSHCKCLTLRPPDYRGILVRAYVYAVLLLLAIFGGIAGYLYLRFSALANMDFTPPPITVAAAQAEGAQWSQYIDAVGTVAATRGVQLTSESSGEVTAINVESGQEVNKGQALVQLNNDVEQASRRNQTANLELAEILYERDAKLVEQKSIPQSQYDRSRADLQGARAQLSETEARIRNKRIDAPFSGTMGILQVDVGDYVSPGTLIASLQDLSELEIDFTVPSQAAPLLRPGLSMEVSVSAYPERRFQAHIVAIDTRIDPGTRNMLVRAKLDPDSELLPGMFAQLRIDQARNTQVVVVPETAVSYSLHGNVVYVVKPGTDGEGLTAESVAVKVGQVRDGQVAILEGVEVGTTVVVSGQNKLYRGASVIVDNRVVF